MRYGELVASTLPWWQRGLPVAGLTALVGVFVQVSAGVQGWLDAEQSRNLAEQELVKEHLESALQNEATEEIHMRRMDFLRKLADAEDEGLLVVLAHWADEEYSEYFRFQEHHAEGIAEVYEYKLMTSLRLSRSIMAAEGFIAEEDRELEMLRQRLSALEAEAPAAEEDAATPPRNEALQCAGTDGSNKQCVLLLRQGTLTDAVDRVTALQDKQDPLDEELTQLRSEWDVINTRLVVAGELDRCRVCDTKGVAFDDALLWLEKECTPAQVAEAHEATAVSSLVAYLQPAATEQEASINAVLEPTRKEKVAHYCVELGEQLWARSLDGKIDSRLEEAAGFFRLACDRLGSLKACALYGRSLLMGKGEARDLIGATRYFQRACPVDERTQAAFADVGDVEEVQLQPIGRASPEGCNSLAWRYFKAVEEKLPDWEHRRNFAAARGLARFACDAGYMNACDSLGHFIIEQSKLPGPYNNDGELLREGEELLAYACDRNEVRACINLGRLRAGGTLSSFARH